MFTSYPLKSEELFDFQIITDRIEKPEDTDVHLWEINRNVYDEQKSYSEYFLNEDEQDRAQKFRFRKDHDLFVIGRYFTKMLLACYTESAPENVKIIPDLFGKPACNSNLFFNISHSGDQLLLGFSKSEIGVDIERIDPSVDIEKIGGSHFSELELQKMMTCSRDKRAETFFEIWTRKESLIKGIGKGLRIPLQDFNVTNPNGKVLWKLPAEENPGDWFVQNVEPQQGFKAAFATQNGLDKLSYFCVDNPELSKADCGIRCGITSMEHAVSQHVGK